jgi:alcohol dehydrogenase class IV
MDIRFYLPTRLVMGTGCVQASASLLASWGTKALVMTGTSSARKNGSLDDVTAALDAQGIAWRLFDQVEPNPGIAVCRQAAAEALSFGAQFVVAIGGGSPLDAAKAAAVLAKNELTDATLFSGPYPGGALPVVAVPTTAGTGSEVTQFSILTNDALRTKSTIFWDGIFPVLALVDPAYTKDLPRTVTVNTALDALSHAVEGYLAKRSDALTRSLALTAMAALAANLRKVVAGDLGPEVRAELMFAATTAGMVIAHAMTTIVHGMGYFLTYEKAIDHGRANGLLLGAYLEFIQAEHPEPVAAVLKACGCADTGEFRALLDALLGPKESLTPEEIARFAEASLKTRHGPNTARTPQREDVVALYQASLPTTKEFV